VIKQVANNKNKIKEKKNEHHYICLSSSIQNNLRLWESDSLIKYQWVFYKRILGLQELTFNNNSSHNVLKLLLLMKCYKHISLNNKKIIIIPFSQSHFVTERLNYFIHQFVYNVFQPRFYHKNTKFLVFYFFLKNFLFW